MKKMTLSFSAVLMLVSLNAFAAKSECSKEEHYPIVDKAELSKIVNDKAAFIVDVNSKESFDKNHVPSAIHFGSHKNDFLAQLPADKNQMIVAYCGGPSCTAWKKAAEIACDHGYTNIKHFKAGISGWVAQK